MKLDVYNIGRIDYKKSLELQYELLKKRQENKINDTLLFVLHDHIFTMGRRAKDSQFKVSKDKIKKMGIKISRINRGGEITYHGPGQIVCYNIINIKGRSIKELVNNLEEVTIRLLDDNFNIKSKRHNEHRGVWVGNNKITAIGLEIKKNVTMHGFAFNLNTDLKYYDLIVPCGISEMGVTSLAKILGHEEDNNKVINLIIKKYCEVFDYNCV